jgi:hypothetical protein
MEEHFQEVGAAFISACRQSDGHSLCLRAAWLDAAGVDRVVLVAR